MNRRLIHIQSKMLARYLHQNKLRYDPDVAHVMLLATQKAMKHTGSPISYLSMSEALILLNPRHRTTNEWTECQAASDFCSIYAAVVNQVIKSPHTTPFLFSCRMLHANHAARVIKILKSVEDGIWCNTKNQGLSFEEIEKLPRIYTRGITVVYNHGIREFETHISTPPRYLFEKELV